MNFNDRSDLAQVLVMDALSLSLFLSGVVASVLEDLPDDAFPGEDPAEALIEMVIGSVRPAVDAAGPETTRAAIALLGAVGDRVSDDLHAAWELAKAAEAG
jgi:hypothetical protein